MFTTRRHSRPDSATIHPPRTASLFSRPLGLGEKLFLQSHHPPSGEIDICPFTSKLGQVEEVDRFNDSIRDGSIGKDVAVVIVFVTEAAHAVAAILHSQALPIEDDDDDYND